MEIKKVMNPKWWLIVLGALGILLGSGNYIDAENAAETGWGDDCLLYTSPSPRDRTRSRMPSSA